MFKEKNIPPPPLPPAISCSKSPNIFFTCNIIGLISLPQFNYNMIFKLRELAAGLGFNANLNIALVGFFFRPFSFFGLANYDRSVYYHLETGDMLKSFPALPPATVFLSYMLEVWQIEVIKKLNMAIIVIFFFRQFLSF